MISSARHESYILTAKIAQSKMTQLYGSVQVLKSFGKSAAPPEPRVGSSTDFQRVSAPRAEGATPDIALKSGMTRTVCMSRSSVHVVRLPLSIARRIAVDGVNTPAGGGGPAFSPFSFGADANIFSLALDRCAAKLPSSSVTSCCQSVFPVEMITYLRGV